MTEYFTKSVRFERRGDRLIPVHSTSTLQPDGALKCVRVTEGQFPLVDSAQYWSELPYEHGCALMKLSYELFNRSVRSDVSGDSQPYIQGPQDAPVNASCLQLDVKAWDVHQADFMVQNRACDNPWVAELFEASCDAFRGAEDEEVTDAG